MHLGQFSKTESHLLSIPSTNYQHEILLPTKVKQFKCYSIKKVPKKLSWLSYSKNLQFWFWTKFTSLWFFSQSSWAQNGSHHIQELQNLSKERKRKLKQSRERCVKENRICCFFDWRLWSIRKWRGRGYLELSSRTQISGVEKRQRGNERWEGRSIWADWFVFFSRHAFTHNMMP